MLDPNMEVFKIGEFVVVYWQLITAIAGLALILVIGWTIRSATVAALQRLTFELLNRTAEDLYKLSVNGYQNDPLRKRFNRIQIILKWF